MNMWPCEDRTRIIGNVVYRGKVGRLQTHITIGNRRLIIRDAIGSVLHHDPESVGILQARIADASPSIESWITRMRQERGNERGFKFTSEWPDRWGRTYGRVKKRNHALSDVTSLLTEVDDDQYASIMPILISWIRDHTDSRASDEPHLLMLPQRQQSSQSALQRLIQDDTMPLPAHVRAAENDIDTSGLFRFYLPQDRIKAADLMAQMEELDTKSGEIVFSEDMNASDASNVLSDIRRRKNDVSEALTQLRLRRVRQYARDAPAVPLLMQNREDSDSLSDDLETGSDVSSGDDDALESLVEDGWLVRQDSAYEVERSS